MKLNELVKAFDGVCGVCWNQWTLQSLCKLLWAKWLNEIEKVNSAGKFSCIVIKSDATRNRENDC